jgi:SAM-dependent methyltransferase
VPEDELERRRDLASDANWGERAGKGFMAAGIDPGDRLGRKNAYIDLLQKTALEEVLDLRGGEAVLDFGCGSGRLSYWLAPKVKRVVGLEVTPGMIRLAEENRTAPNVEFLLYDGIHFPAFRDAFDLVLSVGVLQEMRGEALRNILCNLAGPLGPAGRLCLIEQVSDHPGVDRPAVREYLEAFRKAGLEPVRHYSIRSGRGLCLYLIRYGLVPPSLFPALARREIRRTRGRRGIVRYYRDHLFLLQRVSRGGSAGPGGTG